MPTLKEQFDKTITELEQKLGAGNPIYLFNECRMASAYTFDYLKESPLFRTFTIPYSTTNKMTDMATQLERDNRIGLYNIHSNLHLKTITIQLMVIDESVLTLLDLTNDIADLINIDKGVENA